MNVIIALVSVALAPVAIISSSAPASPLDFVETELCYHIPAWCVCVCGRGTCSCCLGCV